MLKYKGQWQALTVEERLFLLAMAHELPQISGLEVRYTDVMANTGFDDAKLCEVAHSLERKDLIKVDGDPLMFQFRGDAVTRPLCEGKLPDYQREKGCHSQVSLSLLNTGAGGRPHIKFTEAAGSWIFGFNGFFF